MIVASRSLTTIYRPFRATHFCLIARQAESQRCCCLLSLSGNPFSVLSHCETTGVVDVALEIMQEIVQDFPQIFSSEDMFCIDSLITRCTHEQSAGTTEEEKNNTVQRELELGTIRKPGPPPSVLSHARVFFESGRSLHLAARSIPGQQYRGPRASFTLLRLFCVPLFPKRRARQSSTTHFSHNIINNFKERMQNQQRLRNPPCHT